MHSDFFLIFPICNVQLLVVRLETRAEYAMSVAVYNSMSMEYRRIGVYKNTYIKTG